VSPKLSPRPALFTFDIFGTVVDWNRGLTDAVRRTIGRDLTRTEFDHLVDAQGEEEQKGEFVSYKSIVASSLVKVLRIRSDDAEAIGARAGRWPLFDDAHEGLRRLMEIAPCVAMTNSDRAHGKDVEAQLGFRLSEWISAEDVRCYKPSPEFWRKVSERVGVPLGPDWWHVSAYSDYDLGVARSLGLTGVFVPRRHSRPPLAGEAEHTVPTLVALADLVASVTAPES
jgi:2-haloalkanoic acid dehalogenase type II